MYPRKVMFITMAVSALLLSSLLHAEKPQSAATINLETLTDQLRAENIIVVDGEEVGIEPSKAEVQPNVDIFKKKSSLNAMGTFTGQRCEDVCTQNSCTDLCFVDLAPGEPDIRSCQEYYRTFATGTWSGRDIIDRGQQVCHLDDDVDFWSFEIDVEFYVSDRYTRKCNTNMISHRKREVAQISCSFYTGLFDESECASRVENKFIQLAGQGIAPHPNAPTGGDPFQDLCP